MNFRTSLRGASCALAILLSACGGGGGSSSATYAPARIVAFNDVHGNLSPSDSNVTSSVLVPGTSTPVTVKTGGLAYMATVVGNLRSAQTNSIVVAAGDNIGASPYSSNIAHDEPTVDLLGQMGLEVSSVGNHEFDKGLAELQRIQGSGGSSTCYPASGNFGVPGKDTCLQAYNTFAGAQWTYLAANVVNNATNQTIFPATYIKSFPNAGGSQGPKIGFIGLTFKATPTEVNPAGVAGLTFGDEATAINLAAASLKAQGVNAVVVLIHQGGSTTSTVYGDTTCPGFSGPEITAVVGQLSNNVDLIVSGHTHQDYICKLPNASNKLITITQSGFYTTGVTSIDLTFDSNGNVATVTAANTPVVNNVNGTAYPSAITPKAKFVSDIAYYNGLSSAAGSAVVGYVASQVTIQAPPAGCATTVPATCDSGSRNKTVETAMGDLSADSQLLAMQGNSVAIPAQISLIQAGGVRTNLSATTGSYPGPVSYAGLFATNPFHDTLVAINMTGAQIKSVLEQQWEAPNNGAFYAPGGVGEILMPSAGFTYTWDSRQPAGLAHGLGNRVVASSMMLNGVPISMSTTYRVVVSTFLANGGDNFPGFVIPSATANPVQGGFDIDALVQYFSTHLTAGTAYTPITMSTSARITKLDNTGAACAYGTWATCGNP